MLRTAPGWAIETSCLGLIAVGVGLIVVARWLAHGIPPT